MTLRSLLLGVAFSIMWSSAFTSASIAVAYAPPLLILTVRFLISGLLGVGIAWSLGQRIALSQREWIAVAVLGVCQNTIYLGMCFMAVQRVQASVVVIIASLLPLLVTAAHWLFFKERTAILGVLGLLAGLSGVLLIMLNKAIAGMDTVGVGLAVIGVLALTAATLLVGSSFAKNKNVLMIVGLQMLVGALTLLPLSMLLETWTVNWTTNLIVAFSYTTLVPGLLATFIWFGLVGQIGPTRASAFHFLNPFFGVCIAALMLGESLTISYGIGVAIVMAGILAVQLSRQKNVRAP